jgi:hypothetical protein
MLSLELGREHKTDYMLFHIDSVDLTHDFLDEETAYFPRLRLSFDIPHELLLITMPSPEHASAIGALNKQFRRDLDSMGHGLSDAIIDYPGGGTRLQNGKGKDADIAFGLRKRVGERARSERRYSVVAAVAISETETKLKRDVDFWLNPLCGNANLVITIEASRQSARININTWERVNERAHCDQSVWITKTDGKVEVTGPLRISFNALFDRAPSIPAERDVFLSEQRLQSIAEYIWGEQGI